MIKIYDKTKDFEEEILPLVEKLRQICSLNDIPFFFSAAITNDSSGTEYRTIALTPSITGTGLKKDYFKDFINVTNGFYTIPPEKEDGFFSMLSDEVRNGQKMFEDDGTIITGDDGELILKELKEAGSAEKILAQKTKFDKTRLADLSGIKVKHVSPVPKPAENNNAATVKREKILKQSDIEESCLDDDTPEFGSLFNFDEFEDTENERQIRKMPSEIPAGRLLYVKRVVEQ